MRMPPSCSQTSAGFVPFAQLSRTVPQTLFSDLPAIGWRAPDGPLRNPANPVSEGPAAQHYRQALSRLASQPQQPLSAAVTPPFCAARCLSCDRPVRVAQPAGVIDHYVSWLVREFEAVAQVVGCGRDLLQLHLGGGSANELTGSQLARLRAGLQRHWRMPPDAEFSAECDPRRVGESQLRLLRGLGLRLLSFGVFELDTAVQRAVGRLHSAARLDDVCELARSCGIESIHLELRVGQPCQTQAGWCKTLGGILRIAPDRITVLPCQHRPTLVPAQRAFDGCALPSAEQTADLAHSAAQALCAAGYRWIGGERFILEGDGLAQAQDASQLRRNLIGYTATPETAQLGFGVAAVGEVQGSVFWNATGLPAWSSLLQAGEPPVSQAQPGDPQTQRRRAAVEQLLCQLKLPAVLAQGGLEGAYQALADHEAEGPVQVLADQIVVTPLGRHRLAALGADFDAPGLHG